MEWHSKSVSQYHFVNNETDMDWPEMELACPLRQRGINRLTHGTAFFKGNTPYLIQIPSPYRTVNVVPVGYITQSVHIL